MPDTTITNIANLNKMLNLIDISFNNLEELVGLEINRDKLLSSEIITKLKLLQPNLKISGYGSGKLTSLHLNSVVKQSFPAINMVRQILKCNGYHMKPIVKSNGYDKIAGRKIVSRYFILEKI